MEIINMQETFLIVDGPSKFDLMASLFDNKIVKFTLVDYTTGKGDQIEVSIESIKKSRSTDLIGKGWDLEMITTQPQDKIKRVDETSIQKNDGLQGWYDSTTRKGHAYDWNY